MPYKRRSYGLRWVEPVPSIPQTVINSVIYLYPRKVRLWLDWGLTEDASTCFVANRQIAIEGF
jgi:hypothetical protein